MALPDPSSAEPCRFLPRRRHYDDPDKAQIDIPPVGKTALTWGLFMGVSSNVRYQIVFGLERLVDKTIAKCAEISNPTPSAPANLP